jgi:hypothetical protein
VAQDYQDSFRRLINHSEEASSRRNEFAHGLVQSFTDNGVSKG